MTRHMEKFSWNAKKIVNYVWKNSNLASDIPKLMKMDNITLILFNLGDFTFQYRRLENFVFYVQLFCL
jgi:hypothetical protein